MNKQQNVLERRSEGLIKELDRRQASLGAALTEPNPPFKVRMSERDQLRRYLDWEQPGPDGHTELWRMRESNGGWVDDHDVDKMVIQMEQLKARFAPEMVLHEHRSLIEQAMAGQFGEEEPRG